MKVVQIRSTGELQYVYMTQSDITQYDRFILEGRSNPAMNTPFMVLYSSDENEPVNEIATILAPKIVKELLPDREIHGIAYISLIRENSTTNQYELQDTTIQSVLAFYANKIKSCKSECNIL